MEKLFRVEKAYEKKHNEGMFKDYFFKTLRFGQKFDPTIVGNKRSLHKSQRNPFLRTNHPGNLHIGAIQDHVRDLTYENHRIRTRSS